MCRAATPEHSHSAHQADPDAENDIFIEKPMTHTWEEGVEVAGSTRRSARSSRSARSAAA